MAILLQLNKKQDASQSRFSNNAGYLIEAISKFYLNMVKVLEIENLIFKTDIPNLENLDINLQLFPPQQSCRAWQDTSEGVFF